MRFTSACVKTSLPLVSAWKATQTCCEARREGIVHEVVIEAEACVIQCEITDLLVEGARLDPWRSDWNCRAFHELEFRVVSGVACEESGVVSELGRNGCAELAERYAEFIEEALWRQLCEQSGIA
ncbi:hypothetical protein [Pseudomonas sp. Marseille-P8916]|uniref:hypothetical protein n=1 Tax=Pseudomonas sp. Marseille-P8916 TaxID=2866589 RepID=UPI001CE47CBB|nr:hypothetical protein [Pseudomonas sp. Marseille-P8916]